MTSTSSPPRGHSQVEVRPYRDEDERAVLRLLAASLGGGPGGRRTPDFFRWKHLANPFGRSCMLVADAGGEVVGLRTFMRWEFRRDDRIIRAVRAVDTATHPAHQRRGIFSELTRAALELLSAEADLIFNTPNERSLPGYLKLGWRVVGTVPVAIRLRRPIAFARGLPTLRHANIASRRPHPVVHAEPAAEALADAREVAEFLATTRSFSDRWSTRGGVAYLRWRYADAPLLDYRALRIRREGRLRGLALFRVRPRGGLWETTISELVVPRDEPMEAGLLLRGVARAATVDHIACSFPAGSFARRAARRGGFVRAPFGPTLVVNPLNDELDPDPTGLGAWGLSLGDLEVF